MTATDYFLEQAARDVSTERAEMARQAARVEVSQFWPFLSAAQDEADFNNRVALVEAEMTEAMRPVTPDPRVHASVIAGLREDWKTLTAAAQRKEALNVGDTVLIDTRAGQGKWINVVWNGNFSFTAIMPDGQEIPFTTERAPVTKDDAKIMAREWVRANAPHLIDGYPVTASRKEAARELACGSCGHTWTSRARYRIKCPNCGAEENIRQAAQKTTPTPTRGRATASVTPLGSAPGGPEPVRGRGRKHAAVGSDAALRLIEALNAMADRTYDWGADVARKYTRIWHSPKGSGGAGKSVYCFIENADGTVWYPAGWAGPTRNHPRGNISTPEGFQALLDSASVWPYGGGLTLSAKTAQTAWIEVARQVAQSHQHAEVDGMILDATTASGLVRLFDSLSPENQARFAAMPLEQAVDTMWKVVNRTSSRKQAKVGDPCPSCKGKGYYRTPMGGDWDDPYGEQMMEVTCSTCGGSGEVNEPTDYPLADDPIFTDRWASRRQASSSLTPVGDLKAGDKIDPWGDGPYEVRSVIPQSGGYLVEYVTPDGQPLTYPFDDTEKVRKVSSRHQVMAKYYIREEGGKYWVYDEDGNKRHKEGYDSKEEARSYQKALYANSKDASRRQGSWQSEYGSVFATPTFSDACMPPDGFGDCDGFVPDDEDHAGEECHCTCHLSGGVPQTVAGMRQWHLDHAWNPDSDDYAFGDAYDMEWWEDEYRNKFASTASRRTAATETEPCWDCGGTGAVPAGGWEDPSEVDNGYVRCPTCMGTGTITKEASVNADLWGTRTAMPNPVDLGVKVGDIFYSSWGYDQTNIDFYEVVGLTGASVKIRPIDKQTVSNPHAPQVQVVPIPGAYIGDVMTKRIKDGYQGRPAISISSYQGAWLWDGTPKYQTGIGWGH